MEPTPTPELVALLELSERADSGKWRMWGNELRSGPADNADHALSEHVATFSHRTTEDGGTNVLNLYFVQALVNWFRSTRAEAADAELVAVVTENYCNCHQETCCCSEYALHVDAEVLATGSRAHMDKLAQVINTRAATVPQGVSVDAEDAARLDWVVSNSAVLCGNGDAHWVWYPRTDEVQEGHYATPRAAIDAATTPPPAELGKES